MRRRPLLSSIGLAFAAGLALPISSTSAQFLSGRSGGAAIGSEPSADPGAAKLTVESVSREAQRAIKACDDSVALTCVSDVLTKYATALQEIAAERSERVGAAHKLRAKCLSQSHRHLRC